MILLMNELASDDLRQLTYVSQRLRKAMTRRHRLGPGSPKRRSRRRRAARRRRHSVMPRPAA